MCARTANPAKKQLLKVSASTLLRNQPPSHMPANAGTIAKADIPID